VKLKDFGMSESVNIEGHNAKEDVLYIGVMLFHLIVGPLEYDRGTLTGLWREDIIAYVQANGAVLSQEGIEMLIYAGSKLCAAPERRRLERELVL
jgi:hypothetical protein